MKAQIRAKTRIRGRDWADLRRPDEKKGVGGLVGRVSGDALIIENGKKVLYWEASWVDGNVLRILPLLF
jgi:hypothetical protein